MTTTAILQGMGVIGLVLLVVIIAQLPAAACCGRYPNAAMNRKGLHVKEVHHGYGGAVLALIPFWPVQAVGLVVLIDDIAQHLIQLKGDEPFEKSPLHRLADKVGII